MSSGSGVGGWARRERRLLACLGLAAAIETLAKFLGVWWLELTGLLVAIAGAGARLLIVDQQGKQEERAREVEKSRLTRVPVGSVGDADPTQVGVDSAPPQDILPGEDVPQYLPREADEDLYQAICEALDGDGRWIVVAVGVSKVGKSRSLFEALRRYGRKTDLDFVAPVDQASLAALLDPGEEPPLRRQANVLWLDDLEPFFNQGMTLQMLQEWRRRFGRCVVAGTYGGKGSDLIEESGSAAVATIADDVLQRAHEVPFRATSGSELDPLRSNLTGATLQFIERHGLAAYLVAGPKLQRKLDTGIHALGEPQCPEGVAVARAVVDWARCGRTDPIPEEALGGLWADYLAPGKEPSRSGFDQGVRWALQPVAGTIALLEHASGYRAYDYVIRLVHDAPGADSPKDSAWRSAAEGADHVQLLSVGVNAALQGALSHAVPAFQSVFKDADGAAAAIAGFNLGVALGDLERGEEALAVYEEVVDRFEATEDSMIREIALQSWVNKGAMLGVLDRSEEAVAVYDEVVARFDASEEEGVLKQVAIAMFNKGVRLRALERSEEAIAAYDEVVARFGDAEQPALRERVAKAMFNKGATLGLLDRPSEEMAVYDEVVARFERDEEPAVREQVSMALFNKGVTLAILDRSAQAVAVYEDLIARFGEETEPAIREQVAKAMFNKGVRLGLLERQDEAQATYDEIVSRFGGDRAPAIREQVAKAMVNKGAELGRAGRSEDAVAIYGEAIERFGAAEEPAIQEQVAMALFNKGVRLSALKRNEEALGVYRAVLERFGEAEEEGIREQVAKAMFNQAATYGLMDRSEDAVEVYAELVERFEEDEASGVREQVAMALYNKGARLVILGRVEEAGAAFEEVLSRFGESEGPTIHEAVAKARKAQADMRGQA